MVAVFVTVAMFIAGELRAEGARVNYDHYFPGRPDLSASGQW